MWQSRGGSQSKELVRLRVESSQQMSQGSQSCRRRTLSSANKPISLRERPTFGRNRRSLRVSALQDP